MGVQLSAKCWHMSCAVANFPITRCVASQNAYGTNSSRTAGQSKQPTRSLGDWSLPWSGRAVPKVLRPTGLGRIGPAGDDGGRSAPELLAASSRDFPQAWLGNLKTGITRQYIRTITARDRLLKTSNAPRTAISSIVSTTFPFRLMTQLRSSAAVAASREGQRSPRSGLANQHR
jgi:hypothetical protein